MSIIGTIFSGIGNQLIGKSVFYTIPQIGLLLLIYYLMINVFINLVAEGFPDIWDVIPQSVINFNEVVFSYLDQYIPFLGIMGLLLILSAFSISIIKFLPLIEGNKIFNHSDAGAFIGKWFILLWFVYYLYNEVGNLFPLLFIILYSLVKLIRCLRIREWLRTKGIEFN
ncbi:hypothetical protein MKX47_20875 [Solibacillus sp. FSL R7-0668]|uniref:hypothetical protein n=1 Tax=Solibacillus sp. FSL R7-0668 TaxID=2921688 RepID=UPI0030FC1CA0